MQNPNLKNNTVFSPNFSGHQFFCVIQEKNQIINFMFISLICNIDIIIKFIQHK